MTRFIPAVRSQSMIRLHNTKRNFLQCLEKLAVQESHMQENIMKLLKDLNLFLYVLILSLETRHIKKPRKFVSVVKAL